jgi:hypothetical protein
MRHEIRQNGVDVGALGKPASQLLGSQRLGGGEQQGLRNPAASW